MFLFSYSLDNLLDGGLQTGNLVEVCGLPCTGKTQLMNTIAIHIAHYHRFQTLYIDTKNDFSGMRIHQMIESRGITENHCGEIMQRIKCERTYDVDGFINILKELLITIHNYTEVKLLVIDSLPALWCLLYEEKTDNGNLVIFMCFFYLNTQYIFLGIAKLCETANLLRRIAVEHEKVILLVNMATRWSTPMDELGRKQTKTSGNNNIKLTNFLFNLLSLFQIVYTIYKLKFIANKD